MSIVTKSAALVVGLTTAKDVGIRAPVASDAAGIYQLVQACPPLKPNSRYCYALNATHFAATSAVAEQQGRLVGFIAGYRQPHLHHCLFLWHAAVAPQFQRMGLARRMVLEILSREHLQDIKFLQATVSLFNRPAGQTLESLARLLRAEIQQRLIFGRAETFAGAQESELLLTVGPIPSNRDEYLGAKTLAVAVRPASNTRGKRPRLPIPRRGARAFRRGASAARAGRYSTAP